MGRFNEDKAKSSSTLMVVQTLNAKRDPFLPKEDEEEILDPEVPYLSAIDALCTWLSALDPTSPSLLIFWLDTTMRLHIDTEMVLMTFSTTLRVPWI